MRKRLIEHGAELALSIVLMSFCLLILLSLLGVWFPEGTTLGTLVSGDRMTRSSRQGLVLNLSDPDRQGIPLDATLAEVRRNVMDKPPTAISWTASSPGMELKNRHAIQTADHSGATIVFGKGGQLELGENSLVVIRDFSRKEFSGTRTASLVVLGGTLKGQIEGAGEEPLEISVHTGSAVATIQSQDAADDAGFEVTVNEDQSSTITVFDAEAEVTARGRSVALGPHQSTTVPEDGMPGSILSIPSRPVIQHPLDGSIYYYREQSPEISFDWLNESGDTTFELVIARDPEFLEVVAETSVDLASFVHGNLGEGQYYWRVTGTNGRTRGRPSRTGYFEIIQDREPPSLSVTLPEQVLGEERLLIRGFAEPGSQVFVAQQMVMTGENGEFEHELRLQRGPNVVVVEAVDTAGNTSYESKVIHAKY